MSFVRPFSFFILIASIVLLVTIRLTTTSTSASTFTENFDGVTPPTLPGVWTESLATGNAGDHWVTTNAFSDSSPNSAFGNGPSHPSDKRLDRQFFIQTAVANLTFKNKYLFETNFDGAVVEISIAGGPFQDIIDAGGSFVSGGYNGNQLTGTAPAFTVGRAFWTGDSGGFITTSINLPSAAAGQNVILRWRVGSDLATDAGPNSGQYIDAIALTDGAPTAAGVNIRGRVISTDGTPLAGVVLGLSGTVTRNTITNAAGEYLFDDLEAGGVYNVVPTRANFSFNPSRRSFSQVNNLSEVTFTGVPLPETTNALETTEYFVRQQYVDFLGREPDQAGFDYWTGEINRCGSDATCTRQRRIDVSAAFFDSQEFQQTGSFIYRLYDGALGRQLSYAEFLADQSHLVAGSDLDAQKAGFAAAFVERPEFTEKYSNSTTAETFVDALLQTTREMTGVDLASQRGNLIARYNTGGTMDEGRSLVVRDLGDSTALTRGSYNQAFVLMEYYGYLRRDPDQDGYQFWVNVLNNGERGNYRGMVCAFITSAEYQRRFGNVITRTNAECGSR